MTDVRQALEQAREALLELVDIAWSADYFKGEYDSDSAEENEVRTNVHCALSAVSSALREPTEPTPEAVYHSLSPRALSLIHI